MFKFKSAGHIDWFILLSVIGLMFFSIAFVYSASASIAEAKFGSPDKFFWSHSIRVMLAVVALFIFMLIDYHFWQKHAKKIIYLSLIPLLLVFIIGTPLNGAYRWLNLGFFNFQPSELAKFALVINLSALLAQRQNVIKNFKYGMLPLLIWTFIICFLVAIQPNFSTSMVIFIISISIMFIGNVNLLHLSGVGLASLGVAILYGMSAMYRFNRLLGFVGLVQNSQAINDNNFQIQQAMLAFGNGGFFGVGPGQSMQSHLFLPESYGDFIFSVIGEEYGFFGVIVIISLFAFIFWRGMKIAKRAPDAFGYFLASGIIFTFAIYVFVSAGVNCSLLPATGLPMPFISYGGTAVIFYAAAMGILLNISRSIVPVNNEKNE